MTSPDDEFDDFLRRRRPMFGRDEELEPPLELDRVVLRQAREAIESERPHRVFRAPSWGMPVAMAATLLLAFTIILRVGTNEVARKPEVIVQNVSRQIEMPAAAPMAREEAAPAASAEAPAFVAQAGDTEARDSEAVVVDLGANADQPEAATADSRPRRLEKVADAAAPARSFASDQAAARVSQPAAGGTTTTAPKPAYRRDPRTWLAEIERLRAAGETARADAELAEYKHEHRAYAGAPDR